MTAPSAPPPHRAVPRPRSRWPLTALFIVGGWLTWRLMDASTPAPIDPVVRPLIGTWSTVTGDGAVLTWAFAADGTMHWDVEADDFRARHPDGIEGRYRLDRSITPHLLDVTIEEGRTYLAIAEFEADGTMLVYCNSPGSICRPDRPTEFTDATWTMRRVTPPRR